MTTDLHTRSLLPRRAVAAVAVAALFGATRVSAQAAASTLAALTDRADAIARVRTDAVPSGHGHLRLRFATETVLHGRLPATFSLAEPLGHACGRALHGIAPGRYLVFLDLDAGAPALAVSGARSVVAWNPEVERHVARLLRAGDSAARMAALGEGLGATDDRVRRDAAIAVALLPQLASADTALRATVATALDAALTTRDAAAPALIVAAGRLRLRRVLPRLVTTYLDGTAPALDRLLRREIARIDADAAAGAAAAHLGVDASTRARGCQLLAELGGDAALAPLAHLLRTAERPTAVAAGLALRRHHGVDAAWLARQADPAVAADVERQHAAAPRPPRFRSIRVRGGR